MPDIIEDVQTREDRKVSSFNPQARTVDIVLATENEVKRRSWEEGPYVEILSVNRAAIDTTRLNALPLVDQHDVYNGMSARLGSVVPGSLRFENGTAIVTAKISRNEKGAELFRDLEDGHVFGASVGYRIDEFKKTDAPSGGLPTIRATRWTPLELSIVSIPADPAATTRAHEIERTTQMPQQTNENEQQQRQAPTNVIHERTRVKELRGLAKMAQVDDAFLERAIDEGMSVEQFRNAVLDKMVADQARSPTFSPSETRGLDAQDTINQRRRAMADALMTRVDSSHKPQDSSRQFMNLTLLELAREVLTGDGVNVRGMSKGEIAERAFHTTSDFAIILAQAGQTVLQNAYRGEPSGIKTVAHPSTIDDFRPKRSVRVSDWPELKLVNEHGEFSRGTIYESEEAYKLQTYGRIIGFTRQLLINDSLGALTEPAKKFGRAASNLEADVLAALVTGNPKMADGFTLFHANHGNILAASVLTVEALSAGRTAIRKQVDEKGKPAGLRAKYLVVPPDLEMEAEKILAQIAAARTEDVNPNAGRLELVVEDRFTDPKAWYLAVDPSSVEALEYSYLTGEPGPQMSERIGFDIDGVEYKCRLDFGAGFLGWRGWYRNAGI
ncbi:Mu-like prophage major head subunit gpT family protein [Rhizobium sp. BR 250]